MSLGVCGQVLNFVIIVSIVRISIEGQGRRSSSEGFGVRFRSQLQTWSAYVSSILARLPL